MGYNHPDALVERPSLAATEFRKAMGNFATGVAVVTAAEGDNWFGMTVNSLTSVSLAPPLLLMCPKKGSSTGEAVARTGRFAVNILAEDQQDLCMRFVGENAARFGGLDQVQMRDGLPLIKGSIVHLICRVYDVHPGGDHDIIVGEVLAGSVEDGEPLLFHKGTFCRRSVGVAGCA